MPIDKPLAGSTRTGAPDDEDAAYWRRRAEEQLEMAQKATQPGIVAAHVELAEAYLERASGYAPGQSKQPGEDEDNVNGLEGRIGRRDDVPTVHKCSGRLGDKK